MLWCDGGGPDFLYQYQGCNILGIRSDRVSWWVCDYSLWGKIGRQCDQQIISVRYGAKDFCQSDGPIKSLRRGIYCSLP